MSILIQCSCGKRLDVPDKLAGRRGKCPACSTVLEIPAADVADQAPPNPLEGLDDVYGIAASPPAAQPARSPFASPEPTASRVGGGARIGVAAGACRPVSVDETKKYIVFQFSGVDPNVISGSLEAFFSKERYKLEWGSPFEGAFGMGSDIARILLGGLVKRYKFKVAIAANGQASQLTVSKGMSGAWGGVLGYSAMNRETLRILRGLRTHFGG